MGGKGWERNKFEKLKRKEKVDVIRWEMEDYGAGGGR